MLYAVHTIEKSINYLLRYKKSINEKSDIKKIKSRLSSELSYLNKAFNELSVILSNNGNYLYNYSSIFDKYRLLTSVNVEKVKSIKTINDALKIICEYETAINDMHLVSSIFVPFDCNNTVARLINNLYEPVEDSCGDDVAKIISNININREFNLFMPFGRYGKTAELLKIATSDIKIYALEKEEAAIKSLKEHADRTIKGILYGSRISNNTFDVIYLNPDISWETRKTITGSLEEKEEKKLLRTSVRYLKDNGVFIFVLPYFRLTRDMCMILSKELENIQVIRSSTDTLQQVIIMGKRNQTREGKTDEYNKLINLKYESIPSYFDYDSKYHLAGTNMIEPELFRGSQLDKEELQELINNSGLMESFFKKQETNNNTHEAKPLLPFNMGQIGLVLTSGCLDGIVKEYDGQYHAIKGMVTKIKHEDTNITNEEENILETISNKVQINIITPDGEFKELA